MCDLITNLLSNIIDCCLELRRQERDRDLYFADVSQKTTKDCTGLFANMAVDSRFSMNTPLHVVWMGILKVSVADTTSSQARGGVDRQLKI